MASLLGLASAALADDPQPPAGPRAEPKPRADFLFAEPNGSIAFRFNWVVARAGSDLFDFVENQLTLERSDFDAPAFAMDVGISVTPRLDVVIGMELGRATAHSEYRDFVDNNRQPINQTTKLSQAGVTGSLRYTLSRRGRSISRLAWIPSRVTPYAGAGGGYLWYEFQQWGDFVDFQDFRVFSDTFVSKGWTPSAFVSGGADINVYRRLCLSVEGRYVWAASDLDEDFVGFEPIDLSGLRLSMGINVLF